MDTHLFGIELAELQVVRVATLGARLLPASGLGL